MTAQASCEARRHLSKVLGGFMSHPAGFQPRRVGLGLFKEVLMSISAQQLPDEALQDLLLLGARGLPPQHNVSEPRPRYHATSERRSFALSELLHVANELQRRIAFKRLQGRALLESPAAVREYLTTHFAGYEAEAFVVVYLDAQLAVITVEEMFRGTLTSVTVHAREIVKRALALNAGAVVLSHNHPSGYSEPSRADEHLTKVMQTALNMVDVRVLDHFVIGSGSYVSFAERGLI
jgi:hypothetical protein